MSNLETLAQLIKDSQNTVFFGGAGVSTESGIPDFRSEAGLFKAQKVYGHPPETLLSYSLFKREPELFFRYYKENLIHQTAEPNPAHRALAQMERDLNLQAIVTQNIDGLHQTAGSQCVLELHGSNHRQYCMTCNAQYDLDYILDETNCKNGIIPQCAACNGIVRPDVVLYEEGLDETVIQAAVNAIATAQLLIVGGTSLAVYPAAGLLRYFRGDTIVLLNKSETPMDNQAHLIIRDPIGQVLSAALEMLP